jgi:hypothetical protein
MVELSGTTWAYGHRKDESGSLIIRHFLALGIARRFDLVLHMYFVCSPYIRERNELYLSSLLNRERLCSYIILKRPDLAKPTMLGQRTFEDGCILLTTTPPYGSQCLEARQ